MDEQLQNRRTRQTVTAEMATRLAISTRTAQNYIERTSRPKGTRLCEAIVYLEEVGFRVAEYRTLSEIQQQLCWLVGANAVPIETVVAALNYASTQSVLRILWSRNGKNITEAVAKQIRLLFAKYHAVQQHDVVSSMDEAASSGKESPGSLPAFQGIDPRVRILAGQMIGMMPYAEWLATSPNATDAMRRHLRMVVGGESLAAFSTWINLIATPRLMGYNPEAPR